MLLISLIVVVLLFFLLIRGIGWLLRGAFGGGRPYGYGGPFGGWGGWFGGFGRPRMWGAFSPWGWRCRDNLGCRPGPEGPSEFAGRPMGGPGHGGPDGGRGGGR